MIQRSQFPLLFALVTAMFIIAGPPAPSFAAPSQVPGELIIRYKATTRGSERAALRGQMRADLKRDFRFLDLEHVKLRDMSVEEAVAKFKKHKDVLYVEPNYVLTADVTPNDTRFAELYGMRNTGQTGGTAGADIKAYQAWDQFTGDPNLKIGIIDTGVDYNHPDLAANIWTNPGEIPGNGIDDDANGYVDDIHGYDFYNNDGDPFDDNGHGSHCAGTIAGVGNNNLGVAGVCWSGKIVGIKFLSGSGSGSTDGAIRGIQYAIAVGVRLTSNSWGGGGFSQALLDAINAAGAANQLFVAAAGNSGSDNDITPHYPSSYDSPYIIGVAATDHNDNLASFSCYGATSVDLAAPGVDILSCQPGGGYQLLSGTSMATPHVSGAVALAMGRFPAMTNLQIKQLMMIAADPKPQLAGRMVTGGRLNAFMTIAEPDETPPGRIADLATVNPSSNAMGLTWTATGDDGNVGRASRYEIRYSTAPIDDTSWSGATLVTGPDPLTAGSPQSFEVGSLAFSTGYYFAIKAFDEFNNAGPLSNVPMGTTLGIPDIAYTPGSFTASLLSGAVETQNLTLTNAGQGTLDFTTPTPELLFSQPVIYQPEDVPKEGDDIRVGQPVVDNQGGPDGFGYRWIDSNEAGGPTFDWVDITTLGTPVALTGDDATSAAVPMGMDFPFYGASFNSVRICTNGWLSFTDGSTAYGNQALPNAGAPANLLAPLWDDLTFGSTQNAYTYFDGARFIVSWVDVPHYGSGGPYTFQAILYPTGEIRYQYLSVADPTDGLTVGLQNATKDIGLTVANNTTYLVDNLAIRIYPLSQWLTVTPAAGRILAGMNQDLEVRFNALGMMGGTYTGNVRVLSNDPDESPLVLPATLHVTGAPDLAVNPASLDFDTPFAGATLTRTLTVSNPGTDDLVISGITTTHATVTVDATSFTLPARGARNLTVTWHPTAPMTLAALVQIASNDPDTPVKDVAVSGEALIAPTFSVSPEALAVTLLTNTATSRTLRVSNSGGSNYVFTAEAMVLSPSGTVVQHGDADNVELEKGAPDVQFGPAPDRAGGPDVFGYTYQDSDESGGPAFSWVDIRPVGTQINMTGDDVNTGPYPVGFAFPFYGKTFDSFRIATNGFVSFTSTKTALTNTTLPNSGSAVPENLLAVFWDDLNFQTYKRAWYYNDGSKLVIQYQDVAKYGDYTHPNTFEVILYPNGTIVYQYLSMTATTKNSATIGIQNEARNDGLQVVYNALYVKDNLAIRFRPPARFLTVSPNGGTVPAGGFLDLNVGFNAAGMFGGLYDGIVRIKGNDPVLPQKDVPADLTVIGVPDISVTPAALAFGSVFIGYPHLLQATVRNVGTDVLHVTSITSSDPAYGLNPTSFNVPALGSALVDVSFNPTSVGSFPATLTLNSDDPDTPAATVALTGNGIVAPDIGVSPPSIATTLNIPGTDVKTLTISNTGGSDLNFTVGTLITALSVPVFEYEGAEPGKDEPDTRPGILGSGGPDLFGYTWRDSDDPGGPAFDWVDVTGIGTPITLPSGDDANVQGVPVGFDFPFYGATFNTVNVCTNGWLSFTNTTTSLSNYALPSSSAPENLLAVFWDDLNPGTATPRLYTYRDGTRFILSYVAVPRYSSGGPYTFQVILYPSGRILYQYLDMQGTRLNEATIGIQNAAKNDGLTAAYNMDYVHNNMAVEFATIPDYLTVSPSMGTIPAGGSMDIAVNFNTAGMFGGTYNGSLRVASNDPDEALVTVPTTLTAVGSPDIAAVPASLDFGWQYVGLTRDLTVEVRNAGSDVLTITGGSIDSPDYALVGATFPITLGNRAQTTLTVRFAPLAACSPCAGNLVLASDDPDTPNLAVPLTGIGVIPPEIGVAPTSLRAALATTLCSAALTTTKLLIVANTGGSDLTYTAEALSALPASVNTPAGENAKDDKGTPGAPVVAGSGGPDAFGYRWADSDDPAGPAFNWVDISVGGIPIPLNGDDQNLGPFALPFAFPFYGNTFDSFRISSNGFVSFTNTASGITNYLLPNTSAPENLLAAFWDDLDFRPGSGAARAFSHYDGIKFIISFLDVPHYSTGGPYTFQILLYPSGTVDFQYLDMQGDRLDEATIGIQNATKDVGLTVVYNASYVKDNLCVRFSNRPGWLTVTPLSGTVPAGGQDTVLVRFGATGLADGDYTGVVRIASNDLDEPLTTVPCDLHVGVAQAALDISPNTLNRSSHGNWVSGKVTPPAGCPPPGIRTSSVLLQGTVPVALEGPITYTDLYVQYKFDRAPLQVILPVGDAVEVNVTGEVADVTWFAAKDTVRVLKPAMNVSGALAEYGTDGAEAPQFNAGSPILLSWQDPEGHAATSYQLWYSENAGESWTLAADGLTERQYTWVVPATPTERAMLDLAALDGLGVMGSWLSQVFTVALGPAGVDDQELPDRFGLRFAGANPAARPRFELALPERAQVEVRVYDVRGALVRSLAAGEFAAGRHPLHWDGAAASGQAAQPGIYFVRAKAGGHDITLRFVLVH
jgi:subtilisin family serine protease